MARIVIQKFYKAPDHKWKPRKPLFIPNIIIHIIKHYKHSTVGSENICENNLLLLNTNTLEDFSLFGHFYLFDISTELQVTNTQKENFD